MILIKKCPRCESTEYRTVYIGNKYKVYCKTCGKHIATCSTKELIENGISFIRPIHRNYLERKADKAIDRMIYFDNNAGDDRKAIAYAYYRGRRDAFEELIKYMDGDDE